MEGKEFWSKVDLQLKAQGLSVTELASMIGQSRNTLFVQRNRYTVPKLDQVKRMERALQCKLYEDDNSCMEFLPYLRQAEEWQLRSVRQILNMPDLSPRAEAGGNSTRKAN